MKRKRLKPYTARGLRRLTCFRCDTEATTQWKICADGNQWRPLCIFCDIELNKMVLEFMRFADKELLGTQYENEKLTEMIDEMKLKRGQAWLT